VIHTTPACQALFAAALAMGLACADPAALSDLPNPGDFRTGMTRGQIVESFGSPASKQSYQKTDGPMWGAIEDFWSKVPAGGRVELWAYPAVGGTMELYFVDESEHVVGTGFAPEGVVFETGP
jgi:hypothetical protein